MPQMHHIHAFLGPQANIQAARTNARTDHAQKSRSVKRRYPQAVDKSVDNPTPVDKQVIHRGYAQHTAGLRYSFDTKCGCLPPASPQYSVEPWKYPQSYAPIVQKCISGTCAQPTPGFGPAVHRDTGFIHRFIHYFHQFPAEINMNKK